MKNVWEQNFAVSAISREPVVSKTTHRGENDRLEYAVSSMQGYRVNMEDAHATIGDLDVSTATSFFGVYDGHGGPAVSMFCARHLHVEVRNHPGFKDNLPTAVASAFVRMDQMMITEEGLRELSRYGFPSRKLTVKDKLMSCACLTVKKHTGPIDVGSTACVALIRGDQIIVGNAGDCRCVLSRNGQAIILTTDHKPSVPAEKQRIENAGRSVTVTGGASRIDNGIAVSRSIGDMRYKTNSRLTPAQQALTSSPEIRLEKITDDTEFLVMACDGVWDVVLNQGLIEIIRGNMKSGKDLGKICEAILDMCVEPPQPSVDNMTILLVRFKHNAQAPARSKAKEQSGNDDDLHGKRKGKAAAAPKRRSF
ncbi:probable protein phosphatase 2C 42 [Lolium rigidum]|uniref:probable protein phosphatase 2C 42 n=1 Tax=Lolium rigidum TaxID=89674 RepID=UPI001F5D49A1|nr:probable protein phosphatase 2C 42 [Lolium rigidum]